MDYEKKLRKYIDSLKDNLCYRSQWKEWAFGAVDFAYESELISLKVRDTLQAEYKLLEN